MLDELVKCVQHNIVFDGLLDNDPEAEELHGKIDIFLQEIESERGRKYAVKLDSAINNYAAAVSTAAVRSTLQWLHMLLTGQPAGQEENTQEVRP